MEEYWVYASDYDHNFKRYGKYVREEVAEAVRQEFQSRPEIANTWIESVWIPDLTETEAGE